LILDSRISELLQNPQNRIRDLDSFVDEAAPGFELGKKDLQSPALPLGHAAKTIPIGKIFSFSVGLLNFSFLYLHLASLF
jgi:hypothetical protein